jgi:diguanylate cyclase (GGDEF)-like protein
MRIDSDLRYRLGNYFADFANWYGQNVSSPLSNALDHTLVPRSVSIIQQRSQSLQGLLQNGHEEAFVMETPDLPLLKRVLLFQRMLIHQKQEVLRSKTPSDMILRQINEMTAMVDGLLSDPELSDVVETPIPVLTDFLTISATYHVMNANPLVPPKIAFDEKFGILQAPGTFFDTLRHFRREGELRNCGVSVAYLDLDDFKRFNTAYTEPVVDRLVLPRIMQVLESHVYSHGFAYRFGGDEYVLLLPNMSEDLLVSFLEDLQKKLASLQIPAITEKVTISIGVVNIPAHSVATDLEIFEAANHAKNFAKTTGHKNCIAGYRNTNLRKHELLLKKSVSERAK